MSESFGYSDQSINESIRYTLEKYMSVRYMANNPAFVSKLNEDGYMSLDYLLSLPDFQQLVIIEEDLVDVIPSIPSLSLSPDKKGVRISLPVARKTVIIRDTTEATTEESIRALLSSFTIECVKKEIGNSWFITLSSEDEAQQAVEFLALHPLDGKIVKSRIKAEFYLKKLMKNMESIKSSKFSVSATPFVPKTVSYEAPVFSSYWNNTQLNYDYYDSKQSQQDEVPFVTTSSAHGYSGDFIKYSPEEILAIVRELKDQSLPPIATEGDHSIAIEEHANVELVEKGRTMSIDQVLNSHPRTLSVDSIDYTNMLTGEMDEEVVTIVRKQRKHRNRRRSSHNVDLDAQTTKGKRK